MKRAISWVCKVTCLAVATLSVRAATNYWDSNGDTAGFGVAGGLWGVDVRWSADATGASVPGVTDTTADDVLFFGTATNGLGAGAVTVDGTDQAFRSMTFGAASGALTLSGGALNLAAPSSAVFVNNGADTIASALASTNGLIKAGTLSYTAFLTTNATVVLPNALLADLRGAGGKLGGGSLSPTAVKSTVYFFVNNATNATYQLQYYDGSTYTKCVKVELLQVGADIAARVLYAKYVSGFNFGLDFDTTGSDYPVATSYGSGGYGVAETYLYLQAGVYETFLPSTTTTVFPKATLADLIAVTNCIMGGSNISGTFAYATPFFFTNNVTNATVQIQLVNGGYTKCVKVELTQVGADIRGRAVYAKYTANNMLGFNFDTGGNNGTVVTSYTAGGYGLTQLLLTPATDRAKLTLAGVNTYTGATSAGGGTLEVGAGGVLGGGSYAGRILTSGTLFYNSSARQTLSGAISGTGALVKGTPVTNNTPVTQSAYVQSVATVYFSNATLSDYLSAGGRMGGNWIPSAPQATVCFYTFDGVKATAQFQCLDGGHTKCLKVEFTQVGADIAARAVYAKYLLNTLQIGYNFDTGGNGGTICTTPGTDGYAVTQITLNTTGGSTLTLSGANTYTGGTTVNAGVLEATTTASALPPSGGITVGPYGELLLNVSGLTVPNGASVGGVNPITVNGGRLTLANLFNAGYSRPITINGGTLNSLYTEAVRDDNGNYINNLTLLNGAQVTGYKVRIGFVSAPTITVSGTSPSTLAAGLNMVRNGTLPLTLNVADVTGDAAVDFFITGGICDFAGYENMPTVKTGAGTVSLAGLNTHYGPYTVATGTLALAVSGALNVSNDVTLAGGTLAMGAVTNTVGTLTMSADSTLALGEGTLAFADSRAVTWTAGADLTLTGTLGRYTLRFGTDAAALTPAQLAAISYLGGAVRLRPDGYLAESAKGTLILLY